MSDIDPVEPHPAQTVAHPAPAARAVPRAGWRRRAFGTIGLLGGGIVIGAAGLALGATLPDHPGWGMPHHGPRLERVQHRVLSALDSVGATAAQEAKIHDIVAAGFASAVRNPQDEATFRAKMLDLLRAPTIDRAAADKIRADRMAAAEARGKALTGMVLDAAEQLTPDQRVKLAERLESVMGGRPMGWGWHGGRHGGPDGRGPDGPGPAGPGSGGDGPGPHDTPDDRG